MNLRIALLSFITLVHVAHADVIEYGDVDKATSVHLNLYYWDSANSFLQLSRDYRQGSEGFFRAALDRTTGDFFQEGAFTDFPITFPDYSVPPPAILNSSITLAFFLPEWVKVENLSPGANGWYNTSAPPTEGELLIGGQSFNSHLYNSQLSFAPDFSAMRVVYYGIVGSLPPTEGANSANVADFFWGADLVELPKTSVSCGRKNTEVFIRRESRQVENEKFDFRVVVRNRDNPKCGPSTYRIRTTLGSEPTNCVVQLSPTVPAIRIGAGRSRELMLPLQASGADCDPQARDFNLSVNVRRFVDINGQLVESKTQAWPG